MGQSCDKTNKSAPPKTISRRKFLKMGSVGAAAVVAATVIPKTSSAASVSSLKGKKLGFVIDLQRCTGCGACDISCKNENNVQAGFAWAHHITKTTGKFPNVRYEHIPILCNHCEKAPCVKVCPTRAMHKIDGDITMHDPIKCIGCKSCIAACPYKVISRNSKAPHSFWKGNDSLIEGCTSSPAEVLKDVKGKGVPYYNPDKEKNQKGSGLRQKGIIEKCTFCDHRVKRGKLPYCVERCPSSARIFGDLNDPQSKINEILGKYRPMRLREHLGTEPKVFYVRNFNPRSYVKSRGSI